ncbi:MAG: 2,3-dehydroadipyl-CoA hydratase [Rhodospirillaceae bacterium]|nr:2,3-dehydroadipyl-CoA hydratase [Rhodospirillaceae bacterium]
MSLVLSSRPSEGVTLLQLNRPEKRNALSSGLIGAIAAELTAAADDAETRCVVLTGNDKAFSAGADIKEMVERGVDALKDKKRHQDWATIQSFPKPLIAAVEGFAFGGGHELAMLTDIVVAADNARFGQPEINIGILPGDGATQRIPRSVGKSLAMKMILTGEPIDAETAFAAGLLAELTAPGKALDRALEIAAVIASKGPVATRLAKAAVLKAYEIPLEEGLTFEREAVFTAFETEDQTEGMTAFLEKRPPKFTGR